MSLENIELIGADGCPYVQRAVALLIEKKIPFSYLNVDLQNKPSWFLEKSPLGKVPVLRFPDGKIVFESLVILELLEDLQPGLTPTDPVLKAQNKSWIEYSGSIFVDTFGAIQKTTKEEYETAIQAIPKKIQQLDTVVVGPFFNGEKISVIDIANAPLAQRLLAFDKVLRIDLGDKAKFPKVKAYFEKIVSLNSISNALIFQTQKDDTLDSKNNIEGLHNNKLDSGIVDEKMADYKSLIKTRFPKSYVATVLLA